MPSRGPSTHRKKGEKANTVLGYGINALKALYPSIEFTRRTNPILNFGYRTTTAIKEEAFTKQFFFKDVDESLEELSNKFSNGSGIQASFLGFKADFNVGYSNAENSSKENVYLKAYGMKFTYRELMQKYDYKNNLDSKFSKDLNSSMTPKDLFEIYGTHLIVGALYGGRADICSTTEKSSNETIDELKVKLELGFDKVGSVSNDSEWATTMKSVMSRTKFDASSIGGDGNLNHTNMESFIGDYQRWLSSITKENSEFCSIFNDDSLIPIWEFASSSTRKSELINYYESELSKLNETVASNDSYITDLMVATAKDSGTAYAKILHKGFRVLDLDMNYSCHSGNCIYIGYKFGNKTNAITDIKAMFSNSPNIVIKENETLTSKNGETYTRLGDFSNGNLNAGCFSGRLIGPCYLYLYTTKSQNYKPVRRLNAVLVKNIKATDRLENPVTWFNGNGVADMNYLTNGEKIYVYIER